jgi:hypothetical protein
MLRGWTTSSFSNAVGVPVVRAIEKRLAARGEKPAMRGFLLDAGARCDKRRKLTVRGAGEVHHVPTDRNSITVATADVFGLRTVIQDHANQINLRVRHVVPDNLLELTSGVRINGRPWKSGDLCYYFLTTDRRIDAKPRVGQVISFIVDMIGTRNHIFVCLDQRHIVDNTDMGCMIVYDVTRPISMRIIHVDHLTHLAGSLPYWHAGRTDIRVAVPIGPTV